MITTDSENGNDSYLKEAIALTKKELAAKVREISRIEGEFTLRSGLTSTFYWDKYRFESNPITLSGIVVYMMDLIPDDKPDYIAGLEMGGLPLVTALSLITGIPCLFVRKKAKTYGTANLVEGAELQVGKKVVVIEDVVTTAGQVCKSVKQMRQLGLVVTTVICALDRQQGGAEALYKIGCTLSPVLTAQELEDMT